MLVKLILLEDLEFENNVSRKIPGQHYLQT